MLEGRKLKEVSGIADQVAQRAADATKPITDIRASAEYRGDISKTLVKRALMGAVEKLGGS